MGGGSTRSESEMVNYFSSCIMYLLSHLNLFSLQGKLAAVHNKSQLHLTKAAANQSHFMHHLLIHEGEVVLELRVAGEEDSLPLLVVLWPASPPQHLQDIQHPQLNPPALLGTVDLGCACVCVCVHNVRVLHYFIPSGGEINTLN